MRCTAPPRGAVPARSRRRSPMRSPGVVVVRHRRVLHGAVGLRRLGATVVGSAGPPCATAFEASSVIARRPSSVRAGLLDGVTATGDDTRRGEWTGKDGTAVVKEFTSEAGGQRAAGVPPGAQGRRIRRLRELDAPRAAAQLRQPALRWRRADRADLAAGRSQQHRGHRDRLPPPAPASGPGRGHGGQPVVPQTGHLVSSWPGRDTTAPVRLAADGG
jgi:hypothetical protein